MSGATPETPSAVDCIFPETLSPWKLKLIRCAQHDITWKASHHTITNMNMQIGKRGLKSSCQPAEQHTILSQMQPRFEAGPLRFYRGLFALPIEVCLPNFTKDGGRGRCRQQVHHDGLVTRKPITQVSSAGLHPTLHHCILHSVFVQLLSSSSSCRKCLHLVSSTFSSSSSYRKCAQVSFPANAACVEYSVVIAGTDHEFPSGGWLAWSPIPSTSLLPI